MKTTNISRSTPAGQGMNCDKLIRLLNFVKNSGPKVHRLLILRNGHLVTDVGYYPFHSEVSYSLSCCTASIVSVLTGIALEEGLIGNVKDRITLYFPEYAAVSGDTYKDGITIEHLLQMSAGIEWDDVNNVYGDNCYDNRMHRSEDPVRFVFEQPMREEPGKRYNHCIGAQHLLSAILQKVTGMNAAAYAQERLFKPLGIIGAEWCCDKNGINMGGGGLSLTAEGLAKIGQLYLQKGMWDGVQIVPEGWIRLSTKKHMDTPEGPWSFYGCGYQWNINRFGGYSAKGLSGQYMAVVPNLNLVVVIMASLSLEELFWPEMLMETFIIPAARFTGANQASRQNQVKWSELADEINRPPVPKPVPVLPETALKISGCKYTFESPANIEGMLLIFCNDDDCCILKIFQNQNVLEVCAGLDDVYRTAGNEAYKGSWANADTFIMNMLHLGMGYELEYRFTFSTDRLDYEVFAPGWGVCEKLEGRRSTDE